MALASSYSGVNTPIPKSFVRSLLKDYYNRIKGQKNG